LYDFFLFKFCLQDRAEFDYRKTSKKKNRQGSTSSGPDKEKENATDDEDLFIKRAASKDSVASEFSDKAFHIQNTASAVPLVKVLLPDMSSAVIAARPGQSVQQLLNKLLERRGLRFNAFELFDSHHSTSIELERDASVVGGMEIRLEPRVVFHLLLLQSGKSLMIRGQPRRQLGEVVKPILLKYGLKIEQSIITKSATGDVVQAKTMLASLDGCHLKVRK
jgi:regulator of G-protein signaling